MATTGQGSSLAINPVLAMQLATSSASPSGFAQSDDAPDPFIAGPSSFSATADEPVRHTPSHELGEQPPLYGSSDPDPLMAAPTAELIAEAAATGRPFVPSATAPVSSEPPAVATSEPPSSSLLGPSLDQPQLEPTADHRKTAGWLIFLPLAAAGAAGGLAAAMTKKPIWIGAAAATAAIATASAGYIIKE